MGSSSSASEQKILADDRTTKARIRDAAIDCFAQHGLAGTTARRVANSAGVSPGSVIHHFESMEGLRAACDEHVAALILQRKKEVMSSPELDLLAALRKGNAGTLAGYLAEVLGDDSPAVAKLVDDLVADAEEYLRDGVDAGLLEPTADPRGRAVVLVLWSLGILVLHRHLERMLGVDLTDPDIGSRATLASYLGPVYEIFGSGILTADFSASLKTTLTEIAGAEGDTGSPASTDARSRQQGQRTEGTV